ncbi:hypothetical protein DFH09DRAFT_1372221 [Mycena vulgaris]|nr:hypothetical protein DFH09DRAFT_1372221 [Mycena vulgaris]
MNFRVGGVVISSLAEARTRISALNAEICDLERSLSSLRREREALQEQLDSYIYPVLNLPNEIVSEIFTHFLPLYPERPPLWGVLSPFTLGQICRTWREIAVSTPSLWRAISLDVNDQTRIGGIDHATQLHLLKTSLDRSKVSSLSIILEYEESDEADIQPILAALSVHSHRWEEMELFLPCSDIISLSSRRAPSLRTLAVGPSDLHRTNHIVFFDQAPNLTTVTLRPEFDPFFLGLPWSQLTTLHGMRHFEEEILEILRLAVNLIHFSVTLIESADGNVPLTPHMHLRDLAFTPSSLSLANSTTEMRILQLTLPALRSLRIPEPWFGANPRAAIAAWLSRCGCDLEQLHITYSIISEASYPSAFPSIRKLYVDDSDSD